MAKKQKMYKVSRRTLNKLVDLIPHQRRKNVEMGFYDATGFHPIRASADYRRSRAGEGRPSRSKRAETARFRAAQKRSRYRSMPE